MTYLVTGATGTIGSRVVEQLLDRGERPRVFVRDGEKARARFGGRVDIFVGDLTDALSLSAALAGVDGLLLVNTGHDIAARDEMAAKVGKTMGVKHLVKLSSIDVQRDGGSAVGAWHAQGEAAIRASGMPFTFVRPAGFMSNALAWRSSIKAEGIVRASTGDGTVAMIHPDDVAAVATEALLSREYDGMSLPITGPEALSYRQMTGEIGAVIGRPVAFQSITDEQSRRSLIERGMPDAVADALISLWRAVREGLVSTVTDGVRRVVGRRPIPFGQWAEENARAFL